MRFEAQYRQRVEQRVALLTKSFNGAPALLETAADYLQSSSFEDNDREGRIVAVRTLAGRLGDAAIARQRFSLAAGYYDVAGQDRKADVARERMQQLAVSKLAQQQFAATQSNVKTRPNAKKTDDLSKEVGT